MRWIAIGTTLVALGSWTGTVHAAECDDPSVLLDDVTDVDVQTWATAVGRLRLIGGIGFCTGTLIAPNLVVTAGHCFADPSFTPFSGLDLAQMCAQTTVEFDGGAQHDCLEIVDQHFIGFPNSGFLDLAVLRVDGNPGYDHGMREYNIGFDFDTPGAELTVVHHEGGLAPKRVSTTTSYDEVSVQGNAFVKHRASTEGGSSGAAILDEDGHIVAIHSGTVDTFGTCDADNLGYPVSRYREEAYASTEYEAIGGVSWVGASTGPSSGDGFGSALAAGDFNGDGADDLAIYHAGPSSEGRVTVYSGVLGVGLDLDGAIVLEQEGASIPEAGDRFGSVLDVADFDGDGTDDLIVGTPDEHWGSIPDSGVAQVFFGDPGGLGSGPLQWFTPITFGFSAEANGEFGAAFAAGDFDCDGDADLAIGAPGMNGSDGRVLIAENDGGSLTAAMSVRPADIGLMPDQGPYLFGTGLAAGHFVGWPPGFPPPFNACEDLFVGAPGRSGGVFASGVAVLLRGDDNAFSGFAASFVYPEVVESFAMFGANIRAGRLFDDTYGYDTVAIAAPFANGFMGQVNLYRGWLQFDHEPFEMTTDDAEALVNPAAWDQFGAAMAFGNTDDTVLDHLVIAAPYYSGDGVDDAGFTLGIRTWGGVGLEAVPQIDPHGKHLQDNDQYGKAVAMGDFDGDGFAEIAIGVPGADEDGESASGGVIIRHLRI